MRRGGQAVAGVTGASGVLGSALVSELLRADPQLRILALARGAAGRPVPEEWKGRVRWLEADLAHDDWPGETRRALESVSVGWWHAAACTSLAGSSEAGQEAWQTNVEGTARVLAVARGLLPCVPFHYVSTAYVAGRRSGRMLEEPARSDAAFRNPYERSKAAAEARVQAYLAAGFPGAIYRPSIIVQPAGERAGAGQWPAMFARAARHAWLRGERELVVRLPADAAFNLVGQDWVARALVALASSPTCSGIYHLTAAHETTMDQLGHAIHAHVPGFRVRADPTIAAHALAGTSAWLDRLFDAVREYATVEAVFDRTRTDSSLPQHLARERLDLDALVAGHAHPGMARTVSIERDVADRCEPATPAGAT